MMTRDEKKITKMREGGRILAGILKEILDDVTPGVSTGELDAKAEKLCLSHKVKPAFKGYQEYPAVICVGPNDVVVHGIPDETVLEEGDILSIDIGIIHKDVYVDMARTVPVGTISKSKMKFIKTSQKALKNGISVAKPGNTIGDIGHAISSTVEEKGYSVVREMVGHGIGYALHEDPSVPGYGEPGTGEILYDGQTLAIEAIINEGMPEITVSAADGWTSRTKDGKLSALFENTIVVSNKSEILTPLSLQES